MSEIKSFISVNGGVEVPFDAAIDQLAASEQFVDGLNLGAGLWFSTSYRPHLAVTKKAATEKLADVHGVSFRRVGEDAVVEASNGVSSISITLHGEAGNVPVARVVVPAKAMALIAAAGNDVETARIWFAGGRVYIGIAHELHTRPRGRRSMRSVVVDAEQLHLIQKALGDDWVELREVSKAIAAVLPHGVDGDAIGFICLRAGQHEDEETA